MTKPRREFVRVCGGTRGSEVSNTLATAYRQIFALEDDFVRYIAGVA